MSTRVARSLGLCSAFVLLLATQSFAQAKIKIAIWEFDNNAAHTYWYWDRLGPAARNIIDTAFSEDKQLSSKFSVIERDKLNLVLKEQGLAQTGAVDPATAAKVGKILGVKYIILGGIDKFNVDNTKAGLGRLGVGGNLLQANATISLRVVDSTTAERVIAISGDGQVKKGGGFVKDASFSKDAEWGVASETIDTAAKELVKKLTTGDYLARISNASNPTGTLEGKIIKVEENRAFINLGASSGIKMGDKFTVINIGEALIDPDTGAKLGASEKQTATGAVVEVQDKFAVIQFNGKAAAKDTVRKQ
jgi:curli biogenesis system outer membrane secretion channel CsgG